MERKNIKINQIQVKRKAAKMKLIYITCLLMMSQCALAQRVDNKSKDNPSVYALSMTGMASKCYNKFITVNGSLLNDFSDFVSLLNKSDEYKAVRKDFEYLTKTSVNIDSLKDTHFYAKEMRKFLPEPVKFSSGCSSTVAFSPIIYSKDGKKAFFVKLEAAGEMVISKNGWLMSNEDGKWKRLKSLILYFY